MLLKIRFFLVLNLACSLVVAADEPAEMTAEEVTHFENNVRPILAEHCFKCHGKEKQRGELRVDSLAALLSGGESGPAIVAGAPSESLLVKAINYDGYEMPPDGKMSAQKISTLVEWVKQGARWPGSQGEPLTTVRKTFEVTDEDRKFWAFVPVQRHDIPVPTDSGDSSSVTPSRHSPIDSFVSAKLRQHQLQPNPTAPARVLVRRAFFDLIGLPPSPEELSNWTAKLDREGVAGYEALVNDLLSREAYGERWGRHWLDVVRFAQTNGYERDGEKPLAWRYRDYVIDAFNQDKPYDRFVMEQLAGDELPDATSESFTATGFFYLGVFDDEPDDGRQAEFDELDDMLVTTGAAFMGLTVGCARCHAHKFDPIPHEDYYRLLSCFRNVRRYGGPQYSQDSPAILPISSPDTVRQAVARRDQKLAEINAKLNEKPSPLDEKQRRELEEEKRRVERLEGIEWTMAVRERGSEPPQTRVLIRGNPATEGDPVQYGPPKVLEHLISFSKTSEAVPPISAHAELRQTLFPTSGRRLELARWLTSPQHPLTARVMVNRIWHHHFGRGIVKSTTDFGRAGIPPTHPELLDWLAAEFIANGWSIKKLHKTIMLSETYRRSSDTLANPAAASDPGNDLLWRQNLRRLEAESIRDSVLAISGALNPQRGGHGFYPLLAGEMLAGGSRPGDGWRLSPEQEQSRRSVYAVVKRSMVSPLMESFDYANTAAPMGERPLTTVAPQALMLLNDRFMQSQSRRFAERITKEVGQDDPNRLVDRAFELAVQRSPSSQEAQLALAYWNRQIENFQPLRDTVMFRPNVPISLHNSYRNQLEPSDYVLGPEAGWSYGRGVWTGGYEGIFSVDVDRSPFALWRGAMFDDATLDTVLQLHNASEQAGISLRAANQGDQQIGYELTFLPRTHRILLRRLKPEATTLAEVSLEMTGNPPLAVRFQIVKDRLQAWVVPQAPAIDPTAAPLIDVVDPQPLLDPGQLAVRSWGAAVTLKHPILRLGGKEFAVATSQVASDAEVGAGRFLPNWSSFGKWEATKEGGIRIERPAPGSKVVWNELTIGDGTVETEIRPQSGGDVGLLVRVNHARDGVDSLDGYNINLSGNRLRLGRHQQNWRELTSVPLEKSTDGWQRLRVVMTGARLQVFVGQSETPAIDFIDPEPLPSGKIGFRTFGCKAEFRGIKAITDGKTHVPAEINPEVEDAMIAVIGTLPDLTRQRALEAMCLLILNLNEVIYVD
jgi:hypothetical protein